MHELTITESAALAEAEAVIAAKLDSFVAVGRELARIRDGRLYRAEHATFEAYMKDRWGMTRQHGYYLIAAAEVVKRVSTIVDTPPQNEAQARELARLPPDEQPDAWQTVIHDTDGKPTAAAVKAEVKRRKQPKESEDMNDVKPRTKGKESRYIGSGDDTIRCGGALHECGVLLDSIAGACPRTRDLTTIIEHAFRIQDKLKTFITHLENAHV